MELCEICKESCQPISSAAQCKLCLRKAHRHCYSLQNSMCLSCSIQPGAQCVFCKESGLLLKVQRGGWSHISCGLFACSLLEISLQETRILILEQSQNSVLGLCSICSKQVSFSSGRFCGCSNCQLLAHFNCIDGQNWNFKVRVQAGQKSNCDGLAFNRGLLEVSASNQQQREALVSIREEFYKMCDPRGSMPAIYFKKHFADTYQNLCYCGQIPDMRSVLCETCQGWYHFECVNYRQTSQPFYCPQCTSKHAKGIPMIISFRQFLRDFKGANTVMPFTRHLSKGSKRQLQQMLNRMQRRKELLKLANKISKTFKLQMESSLQLQLKEPPKESPSHKKKKAESLQLPKLIEQQDVQKLIFKMSQGWTANTSAQGSLLRVNAKRLLELKRNGKSSQSKLESCLESIDRVSEQARLMSQQLLQSKSQSKLLQSQNFLEQQWFWSSQLQQLRNTIKIVKGNNLTQQSLHLEIAQAKSLQQAQRLFFVKFKHLSSPAVSALRNSFSLLLSIYQKIPNQEFYQNVSTCKEVRRLIEDNLGLIVSFGDKKNIVEQFKQRILQIHIWTSISEQIACLNFPVKVCKVRNLSHLVKASHYPDNRLKRLVQELQQQAQLIRQELQGDQVQWDKMMQRLNQSRVEFSVQKVAVRNILKQTMKFQSEVKQLQEKLLLTNLIALEKEVFSSIALKLRRLLRFQAILNLPHNQDLRICALICEAYNFIHGKDRKPETALQVQRVLIQEKGHQLVKKHREKLSKISEQVGPIKRILQKSKQLQKLGSQLSLLRISMCSLDDLVKQKNKLACLMTTPNKLLQDIKACKLQNQSQLYANRLLQNYQKIVEGPFHSMSIQTMKERVMNILSLPLTSLCENQIISYYMKVLRVQKECNQLISKHEQGLLTSQDIQMSSVFSEMHRQTMPVLLKVRTIVDAHKSFFQIIGSNPRQADLTRLKFLLQHNAISCHSHISFKIAKFMDALLEFDCQDSCQIYYQLSRLLPRKLKFQGKGLLVSLTENCVQSMQQQKRSESEQVGQSQGQKEQLSASEDQSSEPEIDSQEEDQSSIRKKETDSVCLINED